MAGLKRRELTVYPTGAYRWTLLILTTLVTVSLYYVLYVLGSVSTLVISEFHWTLDTYVYLGLISSLCGMFSAGAGGLGDLFGRSNLLLVSTALSVVIAFLLGSAGTGLQFGILYCLLGFCEGFALVMSSVLMRDFSPRVGRGVAMAMWTIGPVGGSLLASKVASAVLSDGGDSWRTLYRISGTVALIVFILCLLFLRDLSPQLRNEIIVKTEADGAVDVARSSAMRPRTWGERIPLRIILPSLGVSLYLLVYITAVSLFPLYLESQFGFTLATANSMMAGFWLVNILGALFFGAVSDRLRVRKPFILAGAVLMFIATAIFASRLGKETSQGMMQALLIVMGLVIACGFSPWLAAVSETAEDLDPARVAAGMAWFGTVNRVVVAVASLILPHVVTSQSGWRAWWVACLVGIVLFIPTIPLLSGSWRRIRSGRTGDASKRSVTATAHP